LSDNGSVTRGICKCDDNGNLLSIEETFGIKCENNIVTGTDSHGNKRILSLQNTVSMNMMGFTPAIFPMLEDKFITFLNKLSDNDPLKSEFLLPIAINEMLKDEVIDVEVVKTNANWFGVTFKEDREQVKNSLQKLAETDVYPNSLWG